MTSPLAPAQTPTIDQIAKAKTNLKNLIDFNSSLHDYAQDSINTIYDFESMSANYDPGTGKVVTILVGCLAGFISAVGVFATAGTGAAIFLPLAVGVGGGLLSGVYSAFSGGGNLPPSLNQEFASVWERFDHVFEAAGTALGDLHQNVEKNWNSSFVNPATGQPMLLSDLATIKFPDRDSGDFATLVALANAGFKTNLWKQTLKDKFWIKSDPAESVSSDPVKYFSLLPGFDVPFIGSIIVAQGPGEPQLTAAAAADLFIDDGIGHIINNGGSAYRADVYVNWGLGAGWADHFLTAKNDMPVSYAQPTPTAFLPGPIVAFSNSASTGWTSVRVPTFQNYTGALTAITASDCISVFGRAIDPNTGTATLVVTYYEFAKWTPPVNCSARAYGNGIPSSWPIALSGDPAAANGRIYVVADNGDLLDFYIALSGWNLDDITQHGALAGALAGTPSPVLLPDNSTLVFVRTAAGGLKQFSTANAGDAPSASKWSCADIATGPNPGISGDPLAVLQQGSQVAVYAVGMDGTVRCFSRTTTSPVSYAIQRIPVSGMTFAGRPAFCFDSKGQALLFVRSADGQLCQFDQGADGNWSCTNISALVGDQRVCGTPVSFPGGAVVARGAAGQLLMFAPGHLPGAWQLTDLSLATVQLTAGDPCLVVNGTDVTLYAVAGPAPPS